MAGNPKIRFQCPLCDKAVRIPMQHAGKKGTCPGCGGIIRVPMSVTQEAQSCRSSKTKATANPDPIDVLERGSQPLVICEVCTQLIPEYVGGQYDGLCSECFAEINQDSPAASEMGKASVIDVGEPEIELPAQESAATANKAVMNRAIRLFVMLLCALMLVASLFLPWASWNNHYRGGGSPRYRYDMRGHLSKRIDETWGIAAGESGKRSVLSAGHSTGYFDVLSITYGKGGVESSSMRFKTPAYSDAFLVLLPTCILVLCPAAFLRTRWLVFCVNLFVGIVTVYALVYALGFVSAAARLEAHLDIIMDAALNEGAYMLVIATILALTGTIIVWFDRKPVGNTTRLATWRNTMLSWSKKCFVESEKSKERRRRKENELEALRRCTEEKAKEQQMLEPHMHFVAEIVRLLEGDGQYGPTAGGFGSKNRIREIGNMLNDKGGIKIMRLVYYAVRSRGPYFSQGIWHGIGSWEQ